MQLVEPDKILDIGIFLFSYCDQLVVLEFMQSGCSRDQDRSITVNSDPVQYQMGVVQWFADVNQQVKTVIQFVVVKYLPVVGESKE